MYGPSRKAKNGWNSYRISEKSMKIEDILNLTEGVLTNTPKVQAIESATVYPSKVDHGDLFFSSSQEDIDKAVENGAYAIVYDIDTLVKTDDEIAWIKVFKHKTRSL